MAWTHEFGNGDTFETEQEAREDALQHISNEDISEYMFDTDLVDIIKHFNSRSSDREFCAWLWDIIENAMERFCDEYVFYEDDDEEDDS